MTVTRKPKVSRRGLLVGAAAVGGGLAVGIDVAGITAALAQKAVGASGDELGVWVVVRPNEQVVIRIARSEMGPGTLTGLAQLVAEELECDWKTVNANGR